MRHSSSGVAEKQLVEQFESANLLDHADNFETKLVHALGNLLPESLPCRLSTKNRMLG